MKYKDWQGETRTWENLSDQSLDKLEQLSSQQPTELTRVPQQWGPPSAERSSSAPAPLFF